MLILLAFELPAFLLGLLFGSFLNVCISRLPEHRSVVKPQSHCPRCLATIRWYDNVPLLSWVLLAAKCRNCKAAIPWRYPAVELATGLWFALMAWRIVPFVVGMPYRVSKLGASAVASGIPAYLGIATVGVLILGFLLIGLLVMDWQTHTLPDAFTLTGIAIGFFIVCVQAIFLPSGMYDVHLNPRSQMRLSSPGSFASQGDVFLTGPEHLVFGRLLAICAAAAIPWMIRALYKALRHREGLGLGDVKLMAMIAAFLGFAPAMLAFFVGVLLAAVYGVMLLARRRATAASQIPLGTFLCIGGLLAALFAEPMLMWYRGFF
jgi:leader peptidase (prepilin peptidase)/N-methyltransferase